MLLPPPEGSITATPPDGAGEPERVQAHEADAVEVLADPRHDEVVGGLVHERGVLALDRDLPAARS